ncbi:MAG: metallophosphoesterase [Myxococcota bacterium]
MTVSQTAASSLPAPFLDAKATPLGGVLDDAVSPGSADPREDNVGNKPRPNYILFSDVHLGADLVQHVRPWTISRLKQVANIDRQLASMIDWYRERADPEHPWRLVIAGDLVDFIGMSIAPGVDVELTAEERELGLGSTASHAAMKMRAVAERHALAFERLAAFIREGHSVVLVRGNHDVDFHWESAQRAFIDALHSRAAAPDPEFDSRVEFYPWFYYDDGLLYVEHGHQFDSMCAYDHLLAPVSPRDPRRIAWSFSDILLRTVARPTPGLSSDGHDSTGMLHYLALAWSLGLHGCAKLLLRFFQAIKKAFTRWQHDLRSDVPRREHDSRMVELAARMRVRVEKLNQLSGLWASPVTRRVEAILRSLFLDRVLMATVVVALLLCAALALPWGYAAGASACLFVGAVPLFRRSSRLRNDEVNPVLAMKRGADRIAELFPTKFVVMGHTHTPEIERLKSGATYVNLGHWGVDDLDGEAEEPPQTHLVIRWVDGAPEAEFLRWDRVAGPSPAGVGRVG